MRIIMAAAVVALVAAWSTAGWADEGRKSTEQERADFLKGVEPAEKDPLSQKSEDFRAWAVKWMDEVEDITVTLDESVVQPVVQDMPENYEYKEILVSQYMIGCGVYALQNDKDDSLKRNVQAVQSLLRAYRAILKDHADAKLETLEKLTDDKKIEDYVNEHLEKDQEGEGEDKP